MSIKRIKKIIEELDEGKQVGTLYHFTNADKFIHILKDNSLKSSRRQPDNGYGGYGYISFTRDKNFNKIPRGSISGTAIVFIVDGDKLSNRFKIEPFNYYNYASKSNPERVEAEERVVGKGIYAVEGMEIPNFLNYVTDIIVYKDKFLQEMRIGGMLRSERRDLRDELGLNIENGELDAPNIQIANQFYEAFMKYLNDNHIRYEVIE